VTADKTTSPKIVSLKPQAVAELRPRLLRMLPTVLKTLLPAGIIRGGKFMVGNVHGDKGDSLIVEMNGSKAGLWHDFATGAGGDIIELWACVKNIDPKARFPEVLADIQTWLGGRVYIPEMPHSGPVSRPQAQNLGEPTAKWDYTDAHGKLIASVYRYDPAPGRKEFRPWDALRGVMKAPEVRPLYNQLGLLNAETVVLTEGEKCADALISLSICATSAMHGAKAPVDKTDWSPLKGKKVIVWPDHDEPGLVFARKAASAAARAGAICVEILKIPPDKPPKWDAADAVDEGLHIPDLLQKWDRVIAKDEPAKPKTLPLYSVAELKADSSPMPDDLIAPRVLTPGGMLVFGGAPKVGKSDFLISLLAHMAAGQSFLGMSTKRPLRIFYLQAEVQYHYLRERIQKLSLAEEAMDYLHLNFVMTSQIRLILNDDGISQIVAAVKARFHDGLPDIIAIDPIRNVFDGGGIGGENDNDAMMFFLSQRVEELKNQINPDAGLILTHHTKKIPKRQVEEDPFQAFSGAGSLRSYYTAGIILYRADETRPERTLIFELRNGPEIPQKIIHRTSTGWHELDHQSERLVMRQHGNRLDAERLRKKEALVRLIFQEALQGHVYTANQFAERFENKSGLGSSRSIRDRLNVLTTKGYIKFFKNADLYGLPQPQRSRQGYLCVEDMALGGGQAVLPTHFKHPQTGDVIPVDNPHDWITSAAAYGEDS
jgi:putative DNA primase/helicase